MLENVYEGLNAQKYIWRLKCLKNFKKIQQSVFSQSVFSQSIFSQSIFFPECIFSKCIFSKCTYPKCIFAKCTRLACVLSFTSLFGTKRRHLLQIQGKNVFLPSKTFWITEAPSMIVENRFFFRIFVIVFIVVDLDKNYVNQLEPVKKLYIFGSSHQCLPV